MKYIVMKIDEIANRNIIRFRKYFYAIKSIRGLKKIEALFLVPILFTYYKLISKNDYRTFRIFERYSGIINLYGFKFEFRKNTSDVLHVLPYYEPETEKYLLSRKGKIFIDIGAHIGRYSILLSKNFDKIISIEADPYNYSQLVRNIVLNNLDNKIIPINVALSDKIGLIKLYIDDKNEGGNSIIEEKNKYRLVLSFPLDYIIQILNIDPKDIDLIKIDVEGAEYFVLKGMEKILKEGNSKIVIEIRDNDKYKDETIKLLSNFGYKIERKLDNINYLFVKY